VQLHGESIPELIRIAGMPLGYDVYIALSALSVSSETAERFGTNPLLYNYTQPLRHLWVNRNERYKSFAHAAAAIGMRDIRASPDFTYMMNGDLSVAAAIMAFAWGATHVRVQESGIKHAHDPEISLMDGVLRNLDRRHVGGAFLSTSSASTPAS